MASMFESGWRSSWASAPNTSADANSASCCSVARELMEIFVDQFLIARGARRVKGVLTGWLLLGWESHRRSFSGSLRLGIPPDGPQKQNLRQPENGPYCGR